MKYYKPLESYTIWLNSEQNCTRRNNSGDTKTMEFIWDISPIILNEYATIKMIAFVHAAGTHSDLPIVVHMKNILYNPELYRSSVNSPHPILGLAKWKQNEESCYYNFQDNKIYIQPQTIRQINLILSDTIADSFAGINKDLTIMIGLVIEPYDRMISDNEN